MLREISIQYIELPNGETMAYRKVGHGGQSLVLIHGNIHSSINYDTMMESLEEQYTIYAVDLRGFGESTYNQPIDNLYDYAVDVKYFVEGLNIKNFVVAGWSTGGGVALELAAMMPNDVKKVILIGSVGLKGYPMFRKDANGQPILTELLSTKEDIANDPVQVKPTLLAFETKNKDFFKLVMNMSLYNLKPIEEARLNRYIDSTLKQRNLVDINYALVHFNITNEHNGVCPGNNRIELIKAPILIIHGRKDLAVPVAFAAAMKEAFGEQATLRIFEDSGHSPVTDQFDEFIECIREFID